MRVMRIGGTNDGVLLDAPTMAFHCFAANQKAATTWPARVVRAVTRSAGPPRVAAPSSPFPHPVRPVLGRRGGPEPRARGPADADPDSDDQLALAGSAQPHRIAGRGINHAPLRRSEAMSKTASKLFIPPATRCGPPVRYDGPHHPDRGAVGVVVRGRLPVGPGHHRRPQHQREQDLRHGRAAARGRPEPGGAALHVPGARGQPGRAGAAVPRLDPVVRRRHRGGAVGHRHRDGWHVHPDRRLRRRRHHVADHRVRSDELGVADRGPHPARVLRRDRHRRRPVHGHVPGCAGQRRTR
jgi:hypothetical protein